MIPDRGARGGAPAALGSCGMPPTNRREWRWWRWAGGVKTNGPRHLHRIAPPGLTMTTIVAMCPYCRAGGVRAPATAVGALATCPKCRSSFTVIPSDEPLPGATGPSANPPVGGGETRPAAALPDVTEPSPVLTE